MKFLKFFSISALSTSILIFIYTFYRSEIFYGGEDRSYYKVYYILSLFLIACSIISFYIKPKIKSYLVIAVFSLLISLYSFELFITLIQKGRMDLVKAHTDVKILENYDTRNTYEVWNDLKKEDSNSVISLALKTHYINNIELVSLSGISNSKTLFCNEGGFYSTYQSDRFGFNNPDTEWDKKDIEYLLIGDSTTHGACVNRPNDIASILRKLSKKPAINLGYRGSSTLSQFAVLREYLIPNVKKIVWLFSGDNDVEEMQNELKNKTLNLYIDNPKFSQNLKFKQKKIDKLLSKFLYEEEKKYLNVSSLHYNLIKFIKLFKTRSMLKPAPKITNEFVKTLKLAKELAEKNNSLFYFVYIPNLTGYHNMPFNDRSNQIKKIVSDLNIPFIDLHELVYSREKNPRILFNFEQIGHPNEKGYDKIARAIHDFISTNKKN